MRPETAFATASAKVNTAGILPGGSHYPSQPAPAPRSGQWEWRSFRLEGGPDFQTWILVVAFYLIGPRLNESTYDTASIDPLVAKIVDLFDASNPDAHNLEIPGDRVEHVIPFPGAVQPFRDHYAFRIDVEIKLHRAAGSA